jgi:hypothetical protein
MEGVSRDKRRGGEQPQRERRPSTRETKLPPSGPTPSSHLRDRFSFLVKKRRGGVPGAGVDVGRRRPSCGILRGWGQIRANDAGRPMFNGKFVNYPRFKKE